MSVVDADALVRKVVAVFAAALPDRQVLDGRDFTVELDESLVVVGYAGDQQSPVVDVSRDVDSGSPDDTLYQVTIRGTVVEWSGDQPFPPLRLRAQGSLQAMNDAIEADVSLDGTVYDAWLSPLMQWHQLSDSEGSAVEVDYQVTVQVYA